MHTPVSEDLFDAPAWTPVPAVREEARPAARLVVYDDLGPRPVLALDTAPIDVDGALELELDAEVEADEEPSLESVRPVLDDLSPVPVQRVVAPEHRHALDTWDQDSTVDTPVRRGLLGPVLVVLLGGSGLLVATTLVLGLLIAGGAGIALVASRSGETPAQATPVAAPAVVAAPAPEAAPEVAAPAPVVPAVAPKAAKAAPKAAKAAPRAVAPAGTAEAAPKAAAPTAVRMDLTEVDVDGASVVLLADGARYPLPARVPPGRYQVEATFDDGVPVIVDKLTVGGAPVLVRCNPRMGICRGS